MYTVITLSCVFVYLLTLLEFIEAVKPCKIVNGGAGTCVQLAKCEPLSDLYYKKYKTTDEEMYIRQMSCGDNFSSKIKVCCPPVSEWRNFVVNPVKYPDYRPPIPKPVPVPLPLDTTNNSPNPGGTQLFVNPATTVVTPSKSPTELVGRDLFDDGRVISGEDDICGDDNSGGNRITGGNYTAVDQYPWLVLLEYAGGELGCGGSLISSRFVLTAAHCILGVNGNPKRVRLSEYNTSSYPIDYVPVDGGGFENLTVTIIDVASALSHPDFDRELKIHDIGVVKLAVQAVFSEFIKIICLPSKDYTYAFSENTNFTAAGWGDTEDINDPYKDLKKDVELPYVPPAKCKRVRNDIFPETQICAGGVQGKDTCTGDSGGPLMFEIDQKYLIVGITSYGHRICGTEGIPAVYTHVFKYKDWLVDILKGKILV